MRFKRQIILQTFSGRHKHTHSLATCYALPSIHSQFRSSGQCRSSCLGVQLLRCQIKHNKQEQAAGMYSLVTLHPSRGMKRGISDKNGVRKRLFSSATPAELRSTADSEYYILGSKRFWVFTKQKKYSIASSQTNNFMWVTANTSWKASWIVSIQIHCNMLFYSSLSLCTYLCR